MVHVFSNNKKVSLKSFFILKYVSEISSGLRHLMTIIQRCKANFIVIYFLYFCGTHPQTRTVILIRFCLSRVCMEVLTSHYPATKILV